MIRSVIHWLRRYALPLSFLCFVGLLLWATWFIPRSPVWRSAVSSFLDDSRLFAIALIVSGVIPLLWVLLWKLPQWQVAYVFNVKDRVDLESKSRQTLAQILGGAVLLGGLFFTAQTLLTTQEGQITERFTRAIEHLGDKERLTVRLGGIYALERIARDSAKDHWQIMEVLTAYVREHSSREEEQAPQKEEIQNVPFPGQVQVPSQSSSDPPIEKPRPAAPTALIMIPAVERPSRKLATDIQAVLTVLARRRWTFGHGEDQRLNLSQTDLRAADLRGVNLRGADLGQADLREARLREADLSGALLDGARLASVNFAFANLRGAFLTEANCEKTELGEADLTDAYLYKADLREARLFHTTLIRTDLRRADLRRAFLGSADLTNAQLWKADLRGAFLGQALGLTREQVESAVTDEKTQLPDSLKTQMNPVGKQ